MNAEIIAVGSELLLGQIANTNAQFISRQLAEVGVNVYFHTVVGDNPDRLKEAVRLAEQRADLLIFTGGLGPTKDDLTKEVLASCAGKELVYDQNALESIKNYFLKTNRTMTENNKKQALIIKDSIVLANNYGMAPGMFFTSEQAHYMLLPGPPKEMQPMFVEFGKPLLLQLQDKVERIESRVLRFFGIGESVLETKIEDLLQSQTNPTIAPLAGDGEVTLRITAKHESEQEAYRLIKNAEDEILQRVGPFFYGYDQTTLIAEVAGMLMQHKKTIAAAESLTGGMFQSELTSVPGASSVYKGGLVCYSNESKEKFVQVKKQTIEKYGAVSQECAVELAENIRELFQTDFGISFTGVAGPNDLEGKMPGTVWVALAEKNRETQSYLLELAGSRSGIRKRSVQYGCHYLLNELKARKVEMF